jgi:hypothetical protein
VNLRQRELFTGIRVLKRKLKVFNYDSDSKS